MDEKPTPNQMMDAVSLSSHVFQLATAALVYMGAAKLPGTEKVEVNLPLAKLTIDTIDMLKAKTEGNRTADETSLLDDVLYQLRLSYVKAESGSPPEPATPPTDKPAS
jgi:copper chaperone CopZ